MNWVYRQSLLKNSVVKIKCAYNFILSYYLVMEIKLFFVRGAETHLKSRAHWNNGGLLNTLHVALSSRKWRDHKYNLEVPWAGWSYVASGAFNVIRPPALLTRDSRNGGGSRLNGYWWLTSSLTSLLWSLRSTKLGY